MKYAVCPKVSQYKLTHFEERNRFVMPTIVKTGRLLTSLQSPTEEASTGLYLHFLFKQTLSKDSGNTETSMSRYMINMKYDKTEVGTAVKMSTVVFRVVTHCL